MSEYAGITLVLLGIGGIIIAVRNWADEQANTPSSQDLPETGAHVSYSQAVSDEAATREDSSVDIDDQWRNPWDLSSPAIDHTEGYIGED